MRPSDYLDIAKFILNNISSLSSNHDAWIRTGISRAYYITFLHLRDRFSILNKGSEVHKKVYDVLKYTNRKLAKEFRRLRKSRNQAD